MFSSAVEMPQWAVNISSHTWVMLRGILAFERCLRKQARAISRRRIWAKLSETFRKMRKVSPTTRCITFKMWFRDTKAFLCHLIT